MNPNKPRRPKRRTSLGRIGALIGALALMTTLHPTAALAFDTGVSDDRVSLPEGPGTLEGVGENVTVDPNMGLMRHSVPVQVPEGFAGLTPQLSFAYSSGGGSSTLGMGWMMSLPSIERMTMRGVPRYDEDDRFVADGGNELVRMSETIGASEAAIYRNRFESDFTRYKWVDRAGGAGGYWQVEYADGRVGFFGADANGDIVASAVEAGNAGTFKYHLVEMVDVYGHRVRYDYVKDGAISLVSEIGYVFTDGTPTYRVQFAYEARSDEVSDAKPGYDARLTQRLTGVTVRTRGRQLRRYALTYESDAVSGRRSRLRQIETFGSTDELYPIVHSFGYSRGLGAQCEDVDCGLPFLTTMVGNEGLGIDLQAGTANLVDINGDALPDLIDASNAQARHRFFLNQLTSDGQHSFAAPTTSAIGEVSAFAVGNPRVQFFDVNGDGFTDLLAGGTTDQRVLVNRGAGDWTDLEDLPGSAVWTGADAELRFMDYDNDMDIDLIRSTATETFVFENDGNFDFVRRDLSPLGIAFSENTQFTDMNGDGLLDVVQLQANQIRYKINFGRGRFASQFATLSHPFGAGEVDLALVEDLDSDGFADIIVASGNTVRYVLNRNGEAFEAVRTLSEAGGTSLPNRESTTTVLAADMNGNGSVDITWVSSNGSVQYLDLFPVRSHLLTRIENGIGRVTNIAYQPSVQQMALSAEEGSPWIHPLPYPMTVVSQTDEFDLLTDVHDVTDYRYRDGFYDGVERQFRGYAEVLELLGSDETRLDGRVLSRFDVGRDAPHLNGRKLFEQRESDGAIVDETTHVYGDASECPVAEVLTNAQLAALGRRPIGYACEVSTETVTKEGTEASEWVTTQTQMSYDGYGNVALMSELGVVSVGGGSCEPCQRAAGDFGAPCGSQCTGDERFVERTYVPVTNTNGRWLINAIARERRFGVADGSGQFAEDIYHYDGDDFVGLAEGQLTQGKLTRMTSRVDGAETIEATRQRFDVHGNAVETIDPNGTIGGADHRRVYTYDADGLRVVQTDLLNTSPDGTAYRLRRTFQHDDLFDKPVLASSWMRVEGDTAVTAADATAYTYDAFGRIASTLLPGGDTGASPSIEYTYELGNPTTRVITRRRSEVGGALDIESIACVDGRGRTYQTRKMVDAGEYVVDGFTRFNLRSEPIEVFQHYTSGSAECDVAPPASTRSRTFRYDGVGRMIEEKHEDQDVPGGASFSRRAYLPLRTVKLDGEDNDASSPHADTPEIETVDGLGRLVATERRLVGESAVTHLEYDALGFAAGYVDAMGHAKKQEHDALGRLVRVEDPNSGTTTFTYDDAGNMIGRVDARGIAVTYGFDGLNREIERFDAANRDGTLIATQYDFSSDCELSRCPNTSGHITARTYPGGADFFGYDVRRRPFLMTRVIEGQTYSVETRYDNANRTVERVFPDGRNLELAYDGASRVVGIPGVIDEVTYNDQGLQDELMHTNGVVEQTRYDSRLRLDGVSVASGSNTLQAIELRRDRSNNVVDLADSAAEAMMPPTTYGYDAWYRSTEIARGDRTDSMAFDLLDNVLAKSGAEYRYDARPGAPVAVGSASIAYDAAGNVVSANGFENTWDFQGRLVASVGPRDVRSVYGADHYRIARHDGDEVSHYVDADFEVHDGIGVVYVRIDRKRVARLESADFAATWLGTNGSVDAGGAYRARIDGVAGHERWLATVARKMLAEGRPDVVALHQDHLGSIVLATGDDGSVLGRRSFSDFGEVSAAAGHVDRYGYTGQEHEPHTGLVRFAHRYLSTQTGQWMSPDPAFTAVSEVRPERLPEAVARYSYVLNNPGSFTDPSGLLRMPSLRGIGSGMLSGARTFGRWVSAPFRGAARRIGNMRMPRLRIGRPRGNSLGSFDLIGDPGAGHFDDNALERLLRENGMDPATAGTINPRANPGATRPRVNQLRDSVSTVDSTDTRNTVRMDAHPPVTSYPAQSRLLSSSQYPSNVSLDFFYDEPAN
jgi:RHS repeat-associated protein